VTVHRVGADGIGKESDRKHLLRLWRGRPGCEAENGQTLGQRGRAKEDALSKELEIFGYFLRVDDAIRSMVHEHYAFVLRLDATSQNGLHFSPDHGQTRTTHGHACREL
jgi:hypothetical protein